MTKITYGIGVTMYWIVLAVVLAWVEGWIVDSIIVLIGGYHQLFWVWLTRILVFTVIVYVGAMCVVSGRISQGK